MTQVVCPSANKMAVTLNSGFQMPSWFDLKSLDPSGPEDEAGVKAAAAYVNTLIEAELAAGIPSERIVVGGFSQVTFYFFKKDFIIFKLQILCPLNYTEDNQCPVLHYLANLNFKQTQTSYKIFEGIKPLNF